MNVCRRYHQSTRRKLYSKSLLQKVSSLRSVALWLLVFTCVFAGLSGCSETGPPPESSKTQSAQPSTELGSYSLQLVLQTVRSNQLYATKYDDAIKRHCRRHLPKQWHCLRFKALIATESNFDPAAVSHAGAVGIAQIMPATELWLLETTSIGLIPGWPLKPNLAIMGSAYFLRWAWDEWTSERTDRDRIRFSEASYNCGLGCVLKAQKSALGATAYDIIKPLLPAETQQYTERIDRKFSQYLDSGHRL